MARFRLVAVCLSVAGTVAAPLPMAFPVWAQEAAPATGPSVTLPQSLSGTTATPATAQDPTAAGAANRSYRNGRGTMPAALAPVGSTGPVSVKSVVQVDKDTLTLGDIFDGTLMSPEKPVLRSPAPGESVTLDSQWLTRTAQENGIDWKPLSSGQKVSVSRDGVGVSGQEILAVVAEALKAQGIPASAEIETNGALPKVTLPLGATPQISASDVRYQSKDGTFSAQVEVRPGSGATGSRFAVSGRVFETLDVPTLSRPVMKGQKITAEDLAWSKFRLAYLPQGVATDVDQVLGMAPRRNMKTGEAVPVRDLEKPIVIEKGKAVTMILHTSFMQLTAQGKALEDGAVGSVIKVQNLRSNKTVEAIVIDAHTVSVGR